MLRARFSQRVPRREQCNKCQLPKPADSLCPPTPPGTYTRGILKNVLPCYQAIALRAPFFVGQRLPPPRPSTQ
jgi:hypothetical protein